MPRRQNARPGKPQTTMFSAAQMARDIKALNSSILILSQKIKYLVRNEKILGRNLLVLNRKMGETASRPAAGAGISGEQLAPLQNSLNALNETLERNSAAIEGIRSDLELVKETYARAESLKEVKYVIDSINPLEFVTYRDVNQLIDEKLGGKKKTGKK